MATKKISDVSVRVDATSTEYIENLEVVNTRKDKKKSNLIFLFILLGLLLLFLFRVPYVGSYGDAYIFEFVFGNTKYLVYLFLILLIIGLIIGKKVKKFFLSVPYIVGSCLLIVGTLLIFSIVSYYARGAATSDFGSDFQQYINNFMNWANAASSQIYNPFIPNEIIPGYAFLDPGVIGFCISTVWEYVATFLLALVATLMIIFGILSYIQKRKEGVWLIKRWIIHALGGRIGEQTGEEMKNKKGDIKVVTPESSAIINEANNNMIITPPLSLLTDTSIDNTTTNKSLSNSVKKIIDDILQEEGVNVEFKKDYVYSQFIALEYKCASQAIIDKIIRLQDKFYKKIAVSSFNLMYKDHDIRFEIPCNKPSKISLRRVLSSYSKPLQSAYVIGLNEFEQPISVSLDKLPNSIILGKKGSGSTMCLMCALSSFIYLNSYNDTELKIINYSNEHALKSFMDVPHCNNTQALTYESGIKTLESIQQTIQQRMIIFKEKKAKTFEDYVHITKRTDTNTKRVLLVINNYSQLLIASPTNVEILADIMKNGPTYGIYTILYGEEASAAALNEKIFVLAQNKFIFCLESEIESLKIFNSYRGTQLFGNGDGFYFINGDVDNKVRFQTCYINFNELKLIIDITKTFYSRKQQLI